MPDPYVKRGGVGTPPDFFVVEGAGLRWLAAAGAGSAAVVDVLEVTPTHIVLERLTPGRSTPGQAAAFGTALASTHAAGAAAFGAPPDGWSGDGYIGRQRMSLGARPTWGEFFAEQRVAPYARAAQRVGHLSSRGLATLERVAERLRAGVFDDDRPPARIHGDLWAGNVVSTSTGMVLIDPAAHGGHGLTDLAMLHLFGAPGLASITAAYVDAAGLASGWRDLVGLHQLHPLLVHAVSHGPAYGAEAEQVAQRYV